MRLAQLALSGFARVFSILLLLVAWEALARSGVVHAISSCRR